MGTASGRLCRSAAASRAPPSGRNVRLVAVFSNSSTRSFSGDITDDDAGELRQPGRRQPRGFDRRERRNAERDVVDDRAFGAAGRVARVEHDEHVLEAEDLAPGRGKAFVTRRHRLAAERDPEAPVGGDVAHAIVQVAHRHAGGVGRGERRAGRRGGGRLRARRHLREARGRAREHDESRAQRHRRAPQDAGSIFSSVPLGSSVST